MARCAPRQLRLSPSGGSAGVTSTVPACDGRCMANCKYLFNMQMMPPSDSVGTAAGVFPARGHSPTAVPTRLPTLGDLSAGL